MPSPQRQLRLPEASSFSFSSASVCTGRPGRGAGIVRRRSSEPPCCVARPEPWGRPNASIAFEPGARAWAWICAPRTAAHRPVEPKPPAPRAVSSRASTSRQRRLDHRGDHQLGDAVAAADDEVLGAEVDQDHLHLAAIVGVDGAGRVQAGDARCARRGPSAAAPGPRSRAGSRWHRPVGTACRSPGCRISGSSSGTRGAQVHAGRVRRSRRRAAAGPRAWGSRLTAIVGRSRAPEQIRGDALGEPAGDLGLRGARPGSTPWRSTSSTSFSSPPMTPSALTSLATIQSQPLRASLARAWRLHVVGLGGEADHQLRAAAAAAGRERRQDVRVLDQADGRRAVLALLQS